MKLYTEEQVKMIIDIAEFNRHLNHNEILNEYTAIELPTEKEILDVKLTGMTESEKVSFELGAKWAVYYIKNQQQ